MFEFDAQNKMFDVWSIYYPRDTLFMTLLIFVGEEHSLPTFIAMLG